MRFTYIANNGAQFDSLQELRKHNTQPGAVVFDDCTELTWRLAVDNGPPARWGYWQRGGDWRLPTVAELVELWDYSRYGSLIDFEQVHLGQRSTVWTADQRPPRSVTVFDLATGDIHASGYFALHRALLVSDVCPL